MGESSVDRDDLLNDAFTALARQLAAAGAAVQALAAELQPGQPRNDGSSHSRGGAGGASSRSSRGDGRSHRRAGEALQGPMACAVVGSTLLLGCVRLLTAGQSLLGRGGRAAPAGAAAAGAGAGAALKAAGGTKEAAAAGSAADLELYRYYAPELLASLAHSGVTEHLGRLLLSLLPLLPLLPPLDAQTSRAVGVGTGIAMVFDTPVTISQPASDFLTATVRLRELANELRVGSRRSIGPLLAAEGPFTERLRALLAGPGLSCCGLVLGLVTLCGADGGSGYGTPEELLACLTVAVSGGGGGEGGAGAPGTGPPGASGAGAGPSTSAGSGARRAAGASVTPAAADGPQPSPVVLHEPALRSLADAAARPLLESLQRAVNRATPVAAAPAAAGAEPATGTETEHTGAAAAYAAVAQARGAAGAAAGAVASPVEPAAARGVPIPPAAAQDILLRVAEVAIGCMEAAAAAAAPVAWATGGPGQLSVAAAAQRQQPQPLRGRLSPKEAAALAANAILYAAPVLHLHARLGCFADSAGRPMPRTAAAAEAAAGRWWRLLARMLRQERWEQGSAGEDTVVDAVRRGLGLHVVQLGPGAMRQQQQPLPRLPIRPGLPTALAAGLLPRLIEPVLRRQASSTDRRFDRVLMAVTGYLNSNEAMAVLAAAPAREVASLLLTLRKRLLRLSTSYARRSALDARVLVMCHALLQSLCRLLPTAGPVCVSAPQRSGSGMGTNASASGVAAASSNSSLRSPPMTAVAALVVREVLPAVADVTWQMLTSGLEALRSAPGSPGAPGPQDPAAGGEEWRSPADSAAAATTATAREHFAKLMGEYLIDPYPCLLGWLALLTEQCSGGVSSGADDGAAGCWGDTELRTVILQDLRAGELVRSALLAFAAAAPLLAAAPEQAANVARYIVVACICYAALSPCEWRAMVDGVGMGEGAGAGSPAAICGVDWEAEPWCDHMALALGAAAYDPTAEGASDNADDGDAGNGEEGSLMAQLLAVSRKLSRIAATATAAATVTGSGSCGGGSTPAVVEAAEDAAAVDAAWWQLVARLRRAVQKRRAGWAGVFADGRLVMQPLSGARARLQLPRQCSNSACIAMEGDCEAEVQLKACGGACGGAVAYCCRTCQLTDWGTGHKCGSRAAGAAQGGQRQA
ncbi:hypothetical protein HXX76_009826 [Chlamydomonas incerta]|uniref:MYND-type domain-containing protein n=1 Tax=Chlamydomonas incerta TaxID=51695 RepID=A0A835SPB6_CHLIN|nr:hypothetical protein HXX76_009826 [Chlamydomonas incerta]|eukprot:KAG2430852.1 hypothetical protein HXX76_009826 [Chlamydomonas incerta]